MSRRRARGQSVVEYLIVLGLLVLALTAGPNSPLEALFGAFAERYQRFTETISMP